MILQDFFDKNPRSIAKLARNLQISKQSIYDNIKRQRRGNNTRITAILCYRLLLNCNDEVLDFLLNDDNFDKKQKIKWED